MQWIEPNKQKMMMMMMMKTRRKRRERGRRRRKRRARKLFQHGLANLKKDFSEHKREGLKFSVYNYYFPMSNVIPPNCLAQWKKLKITKQARQHGTSLRNETVNRTRKRDNIDFGIITYVFKITNLNALRNLVNKGNNIYNI